MNTERICPGCHKALPTDVPLGLCPECLIKAGFQTGTEPASSARGFVPPPVEQVARLFPQLEIIELVGKGGMGAVYKARQPALDRFVALKILPPDSAHDAGFAERFNREARALARLNHPNIVAVHDFGCIRSRRGDEADVPQSSTVPPPDVGGYEGLHYLIMEFVDGANLREVEQAGRLSPEQALSIVPQICEALQFAHGEGIVHRDIKPENILIDKRGRVKITDFGIAKILGVMAGKSALTGARDVVGTPHYMAPEQIERPTLVDHRADIYSLGVVFYEMLTGELPLGKFATPSQKVQVDVRLDEVVLHALEKEPERRYQQASHVKTAVETIAQTSGGQARLPSEPPQFNPREIYGVVGGLVIFTLLFFVLLGITLKYPRQFAAPVVMMGMCGIGFVINFLCLAGLWPFWSPAFPKPNFSSRNLHRSQGGLSSRLDSTVQRRVKGPAIGLLITGILNWVLIPLAVIIFIFALPRAGVMGTPETTIFGASLLIALVLCTFIIFAALKMMQLEQRGAAIAASVMAIMASPGNIIGLPIGIWALIVLNCREVREAFARNEPSQPSASTTRKQPPYVVLMIALPVIVGASALPAHFAVPIVVLCLLAIVVASVRTVGEPVARRSMSAAAWLVMVGALAVAGALAAAGLAQKFAPSSSPNRQALPNGIFSPMTAAGKVTDSSAAFNSDLHEATDRTSIPDAPPVVIHTVPEAGTTDVDPTLAEIRVTFSEDMMTNHMWAFCQISKESFPESAGQVHYIDKRTCVMPVKLEPGRTYVIWLNREPFNSFRDTGNNPAVPYFLIFKTRK
jgi:serine/threonine protein kinase